MIKIKITGSCYYYYYYWYYNCILYPGNVHNFITNISIIHTIVVPGTSVFKTRNCTGNEVNYHVPGTGPVLDEF